MTNEELIATIRNEIERQMKFYDEKEMKAWDGSERGDEDALWYQGHRKMCAKLLSFLSTLEPEKPAPADLEEAAEVYGKKKHPLTITGAKESKEDFIAGAKWDREQMIKEAVEGDYDSYPAAVYLDAPVQGVEHGEKVRVIVLKIKD